MARVLAAAALAAAPAVGSENLVELSSLPLHTQGRRVVDRHGRHVQLACVNWYGAQQGQKVMNGLDVQPLAAIAATIVQLRFNCVRLPFSLELVLRPTAEVPRANLTLEANPELQSLPPMEVFDATVAGLTRAGLLVVLNQHVSSAVWCCSNTDGEGLWYTKRYPEDAWLKGLGLMAARYRDDPRVVGFDLRNEVRPFVSLIPSWGDGNVATDWAMAAMKGALRVLSEDKQALIVISGIHFGMRLAEVPVRPIHIWEPALQNRTIYTTHFYYGWCFDLMARDLLGRNRRSLLFFACWLWGLLALDAWVERRYWDKLQSREALWPLSTRPSAAVAGETVPEPSPGLVQSFRSALGSCQELPVELRLCLWLLGLLCLLFSIGEHLGQSCGHLHIVSPPAFVVLSGVCLKLLYLVWARVLLAYTSVLVFWLPAATEDECSERSCFEHPYLASPELDDVLPERPPPPPPSASPDAAAEATASRCSRSSGERCSSSGCSSSSSRSKACCKPAPSGNLSNLLMDWPGQTAEHSVRLVLDSVASRCSACCGRRACFRLAEPLRARRRCTALSALAFLALLAAVRAACESYTAFARELDACWGSVLGGAPGLEAPVWLSEFGTDDNGLYWAHLLRYMREHELDFAYWSINGEKRYHESETYGLLQDDSVTVRHEWKLRSLQQLIIGPPPR